jgi:hypothetical protein
LDEGFRIDKGDSTPWTNRFGVIALVEDGDTQEMIALIDLPA